MQEFIDDVISGLTVSDLQNKYNISRTTVYVWKKKYDLVGLSPNSLKRNINRDLDTKICSLCKKEKSLDNYYSNGYTPNGTQKFKGKCKSCLDTELRSKRQDGIRETLKYLGRDYACENCGYCNNYAALCFHHKDPSNKDIEISDISVTSADYIGKLKLEIEKCVVLCHNCHMETHYPHLMIV